MITAYTAPLLSMALKELKKLIVKNEENGRQTVIFCEDRLSLAAERTVCQAVGGTFSTYVYTFARFLSTERGKPEHMLSSQGSAMAIRKIIDDNRDKLSLFKRLSSATAAQDVYDTIALLYSSRVSAEDLYATKTNSPLLARKIADLAFLYSEYSRYLAESGWIDRNSYLRILPDVILSSDKIKNSDVVLLGFQSFTCSISECACACMEAAKNVHGLFIGGTQDFYTNEALASFTAQANKFGGLNFVTIPSELCAEAETLRQNIFNPACFYTATPLPTNKVKIFEAADEQEELEYIAANIIKHVSEGVRYQSISVMLPDVKQYQGALERVFSEYRIPFYADRRYSLSEHPVCDFLTGYLDCAINGCTQESVSAVVTSPLFGANRKDKDIFINYLLRLAAYRGGVKRVPDSDILSAVNMDICAVQRIREPFLEGLKLLPQRARGEDFCQALRELLVRFNSDEITKKIAEDFKDDYPSLSALSARAVESTQAVLDEAEKLTFGIVMPARDFSKILKSGFCAMEISLIPPKQDAVFVGDLDATANIGTQVLFAAGLTDGVPACSQDTAILTDRELASLEKLNLFISPKITQVNMRARELTALNISAFRGQLYLTYPLKRGGEETCASEIISYAEKLFCKEGGGKLLPENMRALDRTGELAPYFSSRPLPAVRQLVKGGTDSRRASSLYALLRDKGYEKLADDALSLTARDNNISCGKKLYGDFISPTTLESYFSCPYKSFMRQGLRLFEREEGALRPLDSGNFIHTVLQKLAYTINDIQTPEALENSARAIAENLLLTPKYASITANKRGEYTAAALKEEAVQVSKALYEQLKNSNFIVSAVEKPTNVILSDGLKMFGRIDRVDECGEMVRIIDYKTGSIDSSASSYYMGLKLQLPLYLLSAAAGKRAVGAYYFPAQLEYGEDKDGAFRMKGFMDSDDEVVKNSDTTLQEKQKSNYFDAYLKGRKIESAMPSEDFADFLQYGVLIARKGSAELIGGYVAPSPAEGACKSCKFAGCCGFALGDGGEERKTLKVNCGGIAKIVRSERGDE
jgi:ATP-dependent helicase/nuclease subunit B